ncbi:MAG: hypothetical protein D3913_12555, partial [Candidatus Electrothrix sp. LOE1_4_5]|nr:hypothetical protein [Candidatus Electrothrix gigas]
LAKYAGISEEDLAGYLEQRGGFLGDTDAFTITNRCDGVAVTVGGCFIDVVYSPASGDIHEAKMRIDSNGGEQTVSLFGRTGLSDVNIGLSISPMTIFEGTTAHSIVFLDKAGELDQDITLTSEPSGFLDHPSFVKVAKGETRATFSLQARNDYINRSDQTVILKAEDSEGRIAAATIKTIDNDIEEQIGVLKYVSSGVAEKYGDGDDTFEAGEDWDMTVWVQNTGSTDLTSGSVDIFIEPMTVSPYTIVVYQTSCNIPFIKAGDMESCEVTLRTPDDLPTGQYPFKITGKINSTVSFIDFNDFLITNTAQVDYKIQSDMVSTFTVEPGKNIGYHFIGTQREDGINNSPPLAQIFLKSPDETTTLVYQNYLHLVNYGDREDELETYLTAPDSPGEYKVWAEINPGCALPDDCSNNTSEVMTLIVTDPHFIEITDGPSGISSQVIPNQSSAFSVSAYDSLGHNLLYIWSADCPNASNGIFANSQTSTALWTAPTNTTGEPVECTISVVVADDSGKSDSGSTAITLLSDKDSDAVLDEQDNCPLVSNYDQKDFDNDGQGDSCDTDDDNDGISDTDEVLMNTNPYCRDTDYDGVDDARDNCPDVRNSNQKNTDNDRLGDACDLDDDGDNVIDRDDACPLDSSETMDSDQDGQCDNSDPCPNDQNNDSDSDGLCGDLDNCPTLFNSGQEDRDQDGFGDVCDICPDDPENDKDGDGICGTQIVSPTIVPILKMLLLNE